MDRWIENPNSVLRGHKIGLCRDARSCQAACVDQLYYGKITPGSDRRRSPLTRRGLLAEELEDWRWLECRVPLLLPNVPM